MSYIDYDKLRRECDFNPFVCYHHSRDVNVNC